MPSYNSFYTLKKKEVIGVDYRIRVRYGSSGLVVMSIHGGGIEPGTTEIAEGTAGELHTFYTFSGMKKEGNSKLHLKSKEFDEPLGVEIAKHATAVVAIHGCRDDKEIVYLGGRHESLKGRIREALERSGYVTGEGLRFPGTNPKNICNRNKSRMGVQLEISMPLRRSMFTDITRLLRKTRTHRFEHFVAALKEGLGQMPEKMERTSSDSVPGGCPPGGGNPVVLPMIL
jgi:phage replication-related protein YjqB (UPF0714/DUF867 family)